MPTSQLPSVRELKELRKPIKNVNFEHKKGLSPLEKFAANITDHIGSMGFFCIIVSWTALWLGWNTLGPESFRFDPFPAFVFWLFISNMIQIFLMPLIMIGQNLQNKHSELRAEADYEIDAKAEREIEAILLHLENQNKLILKILQELKKKK